jgi:hypothetical protein
VTTYGPWRPEDGSVEDYMDRLVQRAPVPNSEQCARLAALLQLGTRRDGAPNVT